MENTKELSTDVSESIVSRNIKLKLCLIMEGGVEVFNNRLYVY